MDPDFYSIQIQYSENVLDLRFSRKAENRKVKAPFESINIQHVLQLQKQTRAGLNELST